MVQEESKYSRNIYMYAVVMVVIEVLVVRFYSLRCGGGDGVTMCLEFERLVCPTIVKSTAAVAEASSS